MEEYRFLFHDETGRRTKLVIIKASNESEAMHQADLKLKWWHSSYDDWELLNNEQNPQECDASKAQ